MSTTAPERRRRPDGERSRRTILRAAANLATVDGLEGISIGKLAAHIGMSKSGLYAHFRSKEQLQLATVETALEIFSTDVIAPTEEIADPLERLLAVYDRFLDHVQRRVFQGGCFFASVETEYDAHPGAVRDRIAEIQRGWTGRLEELVRRAQAVGSLPSDEDAAQLVFELEAYGLMGNMGFVLHDDPAYIERARAAIRRRLAQS